MSDYQYPSGDEIQEAEDQIDDVINEPVLRAVIEASRLQALAEPEPAPLPAVDVSDTMPDEVDFDDGFDDEELGFDADDEPLDEEDLPAPIIRNKGISDTAPPKSDKSDKTPTSFSQSGYNLEYRRNDFRFEERPFTYDDPYNPLSSKDFDRMFVCRTNEFDPQTGAQRLIEANPNDPRHLIEAMYQAASISNTNKINGSIEKFGAARTTTGISMVFAAGAMKRCYEAHGLDYSVMSNPSSVRASVLKGTLDVLNPKILSYGFVKANEGFHRLYSDNFLMQMNHRLTQEAIEKNRSYFPDGTPLSSFDQSGFTWDRFVKVAEQCASDAFKRTKYQMDLIKKHQIVVEQAQAFSKSFKQSLVPKIERDGFIESFGKEFKPRRGEKKADAITRMRQEFKVFSGKKFDELSGKGIDLILAQGMAASRGRTHVRVDDIKDAQDLFRTMRKDPVKYRSTESIIKAVTGNDQELTKQLLHSLDGRSTFQRAYKTMERYGEHLNAHQAGRTRLKAEDRSSGKAFAASTLLGVPPEGLSGTMKNALKSHGYSPKEALAARDRMLKSVGKLRVAGGGETSREELRKPLLDRAATKAARSMDKDDQQKPKDDEGPDRDPDRGPGRGKGR